MSTAALSPCDLNLALATAAQPCRHPTATLAASILGSGLAFIDGSVMNVALPAIDHDLHPGPEGLAWLITAYLLTLTALILLGGAAGDHYGRRRLLLAGIGLFLAASLVCAAAPTLAIILVGRVAQGIGAAMLMPNSLALLGAGRIELQPIQTVTLKTQQILTGDTKGAPATLAGELRIP